MISYGTDIRKSIEKPMIQEKLSAITQRIKTDLTLKEETEKLRLLRSIDKQVYQMKKVQLPYICTSIFKEGKRKKNCFIYAKRMILDVDHCSTDQNDLFELKKTIDNDPQVAMAFISPGGDGIKVILTFDKKIISEDLYREVYKHTAVAFGRRHDIIKYIDIKTHDPERVCFICHDESVYLNEKSIPVLTDITSVGNTEELTFEEAESFSFNAINNDPSILILLTEEKLKQLFSTFKAKELLTLHDTLKNHPGKTNFEAVNTILASQLKKAPKPDPVKDEEMTEIRKKLNPDARIKTKPSYYVPQILNDVIPAITTKAKEIGLALKEVNDISYGKKLLFTYKNKFAEVNLFYGKHGFKVVITSKRGYDATLAEITELLIDNVLAETDFVMQSTDKDLEELLQLLS